MSQTTKRALSASLKNMLLQKPLSKITVNDIAEDCGVSRMTFYYYFTDIYDLVEWTCQEEAAKALLKQGVRRVFVTLGEDGVYYRDGNGLSRRYRPDTVTMKNATGAGDAFTAGLLLSYLEGSSLDDTLRRACACSAVAVSAAETVSPLLSETEIAKYTGGIFL